MATTELHRTNSTSIVVPNDINSDGIILVRDYHKLVEALSPLRCKGHERFKQILKQLCVPKKTINTIIMAPDLYATHQQWLEWLWTISTPPYDIPLSQFLDISGSVIQGNKQVNTIIDWKSIRGQEELVHKAVRVIYPKPKGSDFFPQVLIYIFYLLSFPGSLLILLIKMFNSCLIIYVPHCVLWTVAGVFNFIIMGHLLMIQSEENKRYKLYVGSFSFALGLILVAGIYGIVTYFYHLHYLEEKWLKGNYHKKKNTKRHYAENRTVAWLFKRVFQIELPSFTSKWVYPVIYPLLGLIPGCIGFLVYLKVLKNDATKSNNDLLTWIGIICGNIIAFTKAIRLTAKVALFRDPALDRLKRVSSD